MGADRPSRAEAPGLGHFPALDGLRAVALVTVLAFHGGFTWVRGGYLPLTSFFVLSGFLITALLLRERHHGGRIDLGRFWARRARRLAPAAILGIAAAATYVAFGSDRAAPEFAGDAVSSVTWSVNWRFIFSGRTYEAAFAEPSALQHYWSLAVEEQFYLLMPLLAAGTLALGRGRRRHLVGATTALIVASTLTMVLLHHPGDAPLRVYFGTDTRAAELLVGVLLAAAVVRNGSVTRFTGRVRSGIDAAGVLALATSAFLWLRTPEYDDRLYEGGLLGIAALAALVVLAATQQGSITARLLGCRPLASFGRISYGVYLFHWPIFLWLSPERTGLGVGALFAVRMAATVSLALLSFHLVEQPIRRGALSLRFGRLAWADATVAVVALAALAAGATPGATPLVVTLGDQRATAPAPVAPAPTTTTTTPVVAPSSGDGGAVPLDAGSSEGQPPPTARPAATTPTTEEPAPLPPPPPPPLRVMVIGDSIARNLVFGLQSWSRGGAVAVIDDASVPGCPAEGGGLRYMVQADPWPVPEECSWWRTGARARLDSFVPDVVVVATGLNELFLRTHESWEGQQALGGGVYDERLRQTYLELIDAFSATGVPILWLEPPCVRYYRVLYSVEDGAARMAALRSVMAAATAARGVPVRALDEPICPAGYSDTVLGIPGARPDGYHIADVASVAVAEQWLGPLLLQASGR